MSLADSQPPAAAADFREHTLRMLSEVTDRLGLEFDPAVARQELLARAHEDPVEAMSAAAARVGLAAVPRRMAVADAAWLADGTLPVAGWSAADGEWLVLTRHGFFRPGVWRSSEPDDPSSGMDRGSLARRLGAPGPGQPVDLVILHAVRPAQAVSSQDAPHGAGDGHGHAHAHGDVSPVRRFIALMRPEAPELWTIAVFSAVTGLLYLALPLAVNAFISNLSFGTQSGPFVQGLVAIAVVLCLCLAVAAALRGLQHVAAEVIQRRIFVRLGSDISYRLPNVDLEAIDGVHAPELVNRFLDVITVQKAASTFLLTGINLVLGAAIGLTVLAFYHPFLLAFSLGLLVAVALIVLLGGRRAVETSVRESRRKYEVVDWLEELARHPRVFKGQGGAELARGRADDLVRGYLEARRDHFRILLRQIWSLLALEAAAATLLLAVGGWLVLSQQLTLGQLVASEIIVSAIVASISKLGKQFEAWYDAVAAMDKLGHLVDLRLERTGGEAPPVPPGGASVEVRDLAYARLGRRPAFEGVAFSVRPGERVALLGTRGSGTSSLLEIILGMRRPLRGEVAVDGLGVQAWDLAALRSQACIIRSTDLISGTIAENIRLGDAAMSVRTVQQALEDVGLLDIVRALPDGMGTQLVTGGLPLAGRQRARLLAARALAHRPRLLLLDELLDGHEGTLDALSRVLLDAPHPWTVIVATRDRRVAARCQRTVEIGAAVDSGVRHG